MSQMEKQSGLKGTFILGFGGLSFGIIVQAKGIVAACLEDMVVIVIGLSKKLVINVNGFTILSHMEVAVGEPKTIFDLNVDVSFTFEKCDSADPVSGLYVVLESGHFLLFDFLATEILSWDLGDFGLWDGSSWTIHWREVMILVADFKFLLFIKFQIQSNKSSFPKMFYFLSFHLLNFTQWL